MYPRFLLGGDSSIIVQFENEISQKVHKKVMGLTNAIMRAKIKGVIECVPTYNTVFITYNPKKTTHEKIIEKIKSLNFDGKDQKKKARILKIPVCYGQDFGGDLEEISKITGLSREEIIKIHSEKEYLIYMIGFLPGFAYLGGLDERLIVPRLENPKLKIPAGSVAIGGSQTGIYPVDSPGGWRIIGRTPIKVYDQERKNPVLFSAGDYIKFEVIDSDMFYKNQRGELKWELE